jgi:ABC-2 type transport system permease protein
MIADVATVMWKEWRSLFSQPGSRTRMILTVAIPIGYFGVFWPLQDGADFVTGAEPWFIAIVVPLLTVVMTAPDSVAGERERKTLRTLLASRLPDSAILWGKVIFSGLLGVAMMLFTLILALVVVNTTEQGQGLILIAADRMAFILAVSVLLSAMATGAAVLISLRAKTVQQAQQTLAAAFFLIPTVVGPIILLTSRGSNARPLEELFRTLATPTGRTAVILTLGVLATTLLAAARVRFRRNRLAS